MISLPKVCPNWCHQSAQSLPKVCPKWRVSLPKPQVNVLNPHLAIGDVTGGGAASGDLTGGGTASGDMTGGGAASVGVTSGMSATGGVPGGECEALPCGTWDIACCGRGSGAGSRGRRYARTTSSRGPVAAPCKPGTRGLPLQSSAGGEHFGAHRLTSRLDASSFCGTCFKH